MFWIDGTSVATLENTLVTNVASVVGVNKHYKEALNWLSNEEQEWLLIIDNADDFDDDLHKYFPQGANGHVLITTRNQDCLSNNVGSVAFDGMQRDDANKLFFKLAKIPHTAKNQSLVDEILDKLGYLALAIVVAGSAVLRGVCELEDFMKDWMKEWRENRSGNQALSFGEASKQQRVSKMKDFMNYFIKGWGENRSGNQALGFVEDPEQQRYVWVSF